MRQTKIGLSLVTRCASLGTENTMNSENDYIENRNLHSRLGVKCKRRKRASTNPNAIHGTENSNNIV